ncbi:glycosyltransferase family 2 protein [Peribacillus cavernae]|uniref:Glycosyltransferase family 2 protein n=1 Tax=Peribacillus cavernae TaxID=1674310 RepID=A0A433HMC8_9BACI|nr:glycosyltransferase family A protein [Peribacillus cavernae]MDQ0218885.1 spore maturation protein CgeD [Peribacillus cavernae]RUQ29393.1 glycosyltransferase family 2 protein [Peribacillus cavernae]
MKPKVSIILTCYNKPGTVGDAIQSVMDQSFENWELYIMDDASNKVTEEVIKPYLTDPRIYYLNSQVQDEDRYKTARYATLINVAIPLTRGEYLSYLTDDNFYLPNRLEAMVAFLDQSPHIDIVYSKQKVKNVKRDLSVISEYTRNTRGILQKAANLVDHCSVIHRRKIANQVYKKFGSYWDDDPAFWHNGDAAFWDRLNEFQPFHPIDCILDICFKTPSSFQSLNAYLPDLIPDGSIVKSVRAEHFFIDNQLRRKVDEQICRKVKVNIRKAIDVHDPILFTYKEGAAIDDTVFSNVTLFPNLLLVKAKNKPGIFYIQNNQKRLILNKMAFHGYKFHTNQLTFVSESLLDQFPAGENITLPISRETILPDRILFLKGNDFYLSFGNCMHYIERKILNKLGFSIKQAVRIDEEIFSFYSQGKPFIWEQKNV